MSNTILVTGANGFVGGEVCEALRAQNAQIRRIVKYGTSRPQDDIDGIELDIGPDTNWEPYLDSVETIIHLAARVHVMAETASDPLQEFRKINVHGTVQLARAATKAEVKRLVYISSIKVNGESTDSRDAFSESDPTSPEDPYAASKWESEQELRRIASASGLEVVIVRPPLVYGPGVKANFRKLIWLADRALPLPLASVQNQRSFVGVRNLADFITQCTTHPAAANETFLISDGQDLSTPELLRKAARHLGRPSRLFPMPVSLLKAGAKVLGKESTAQRLLGNLAVSSAKAQNLLDWQPPYTVDEELANTAAWYQSTIRK